MNILDWITEGEYPVTYKTVLAVLTCALAAQASAQDKQPVTIPVQALSSVEQQYQKVKDGASDEKLLSVVTSGGDITKVPSSVLEHLDAPASTGPISVLEVPITPGANTIIPVALGHQNRIVTPFDKPDVNTVSDADIKVKENVIYVAPSDDAPVTMYITPQGDESVALSLTLAPKRIPPVQASLVVNTGAPAAGNGNRVTGATAAPDLTPYSRSAKKWEESQPYMQTMRKLMRALALNQVPAGYTNTKITAANRVPACRQRDEPALQFTFANGQWMQGHHFNVFIGVVKNLSDKPILIDESACTHPHLAAVAVWPNNLLEPNQRTEIYVVTRVSATEAKATERPSLLQ